MVRLEMYVIRREDGSYYIASFGPAQWDKDVQHAQKFSTISHVGKEYHYVSKRNSKIKYAIEKLVLSSEEDVDVDLVNSLIEKERKEQQISAMKRKIEKDRKDILDAQEKIDQLKRNLNNTNIDRR